MTYRVLLLGIYLFTAHCWADVKPIKVGVYAAGTLSWELAVLNTDAQFKNAGFSVEQHPLANAEAGKIALQSGALDIIVSDWLWVSRLRASGSDVTFYPYSSASGALMVAQDSTIKAIADLKGKRLGIAGGELDKNWLLLQALAKQQNLMLDSVVEKVYAAPPLINEQLKQGRIDSALNYWHYGANLEAEGYRQIIDGKTILEGLGIQENVPTLGYIFKEEWATANRATLKAFLDAGYKAKTLICNSDKAWQTVIPLTHANNEKSQTLLRKRYCEGEIKHWGKAEQQAAERLYELLHQLSHNKLTGTAKHIKAGTFWSFDQ
jgi:NitT/TauT family transport system substrate-binding protein